MENLDYTSDPAIDMVIPESWMAYGVQAEVANMIAEGFPEYWVKVVASHHPEQAQNIAVEMARQSRSKNLAQVASATLPKPYSLDTKRPQSQFGDLLHQFQEKHYPESIPEPRVNPFQQLLEDTQQGVPASAEDWREAAHDLATSFLESGRRVSVPPQSQAPSKPHLPLPQPPPLPPATKEQSAIEPSLPPTLQSVIEVSHLSPTEPDFQQPPDPPKPRPTLLDLAQYPGRFEWDSHEGRYLEK